MTTTDTTDTPATATVRFLDVLPEHGGKRQALEWQPCDSFAGGAEGFVVLTSARDRCGYAVTRVRGSGPLLYFLFTKTGDGGTDRTRESYLVSCTVNGNDPACECRGFQRHRHCRHSDALASLFANGWLS